MQKILFSFHNKKAQNLNCHLEEKSLLNFDAAFCRENNKNKHNFGHQIKFYAFKITRILLHFFSLNF